MVELQSFVVGKYGHHLCLAFCQSLAPMKFLLNFKVIGDLLNIRERLLNFSRLKLDDVKKSPTCTSVFCIISFLEVWFFLFLLFWFHELSIKLFLEFCFAFHLFFRRDFSEFNYLRIFLLCFSGKVGIFILLFEKCLAWKLVLWLSVYSW